MNALVNKLSERRDAHERQPTCPAARACANLGVCSRPRSFLNRLPDSPISSLDDG